MSGKLSEIANIAWGPADYYGNKGRVGIVHGINKVRNQNPSNNVTIEGIER